MLEIIRWTFGSLALLFSGFVIILNYGIIVTWFAKHNHNSMIPILAGLTGMLGMFMIPIEKVNRIWWVPIVIDPACGTTLIALLVYMIRERMKALK